MPVAIALIIGVAVIAIVLVGVVWAILVLLPFYAILGVAVVLIWRARRRDAEAAESVSREAERQRLFNEQEHGAWQASLQKQQRNAAKRERMLRQFDSTRDPPPPTD
jgi:uncharacterized protein (DUF58 family)